MTDTKPPRLNPEAQKAHDEAKKKYALEHAGYALEVAKRSGSGLQTEPKSAVDWAWRAQHLREHAEYLHGKAEEFWRESERYRGLAEQADYLARNP